MDLLKQRGFIQLPMMAWGAIAAGAVILGLTGALYAQNVRLAGCKAELRGAQSQLTVLGSQIEAQNAAVTVLEADGKRRTAEAATALQAARAAAAGARTQADRLEAALAQRRTTVAVSKGEGKPAAAPAPESTCPAGAALLEVRRALSAR